MDLNLRFWFRFEVRTPSNTLMDQKTPPANLNLWFRKCEVVVDPEKPLLIPKTENEWLSLFSRRPTYELGGGLMLLENMNVIVKERKNWEKKFEN